MKRNTYLIIISVITVLCVVFGTIFNVVRLSASFIGNLSSAYDADASSNVDTQLDAFENIDVNVDIAELVITEGSQFGYTLTERRGFSIGNTLKTDVTVDDNTLKVTQRGSNGIISIGSSEYRLTVTIPSGTMLNSVNITSNVGDVKIINISMLGGKITADVGNITVSGTSFSSLDISADIGNVNLSGISGISDFNTEIKTDVGNITYLGAGYKNSLSKKSDASATFLSITADIGNIVVTE
jgi:hypothetical protein